MVNSNIIYHMKRQDLDIEKLKRALEEELKAVEGELKTVGRVNPDNPVDWEATSKNTEDLSADPNLTADKIEEFESNTAILKELEIRFNDIKEALQRIESDEYGICEVGGEEIEKERLEANPAATTCVIHA